MSFADTLAAIREQEGVVYVPHPFDRMHSIPAPATLHRHLAEIDVLEVYNARLLFDAYNDEALRFARKHGLLMGAGSDAHVLQGVGTGALRMRRFDGPEEFLLSLRTATVLRRPEVARVPPVAQVGRPGPREGRRRQLTLPPKRKLLRPPPNVTTMMATADQPDRASRGVGREAIEPSPTRSRSATSSGRSARSTSSATSCSRSATSSTSPCSAAATRSATSSCSSTGRRRARSTRASPSSAERARRS